MKIILKPILHLYFCRGSSCVYWILRLFSRGCQFLIVYNNTTIFNKIFIYISFVTLREGTSMSFNKPLRRIDLNYELKTPGAATQKSNPSSLYFRMFLFYSVARSPRGSDYDEQSLWNYVSWNNFCNNNFLLETILKIFANSDE